MAQQAATARATFELENAVAAVDDSDALFRYDSAAQRATEQQRPWRDNPHYFKQCAHASTLCGVACGTTRGARLRICSVHGRVAKNSFSFAHCARLA
jgi:COP9 signalosome complex subunit 5